MIWYIVGYFSVAAMVFALGLLAMFDKRHKRGDEYANLTTSEFNGVIMTALIWPLSMLIVVAGLIYGKRIAQEDGSKDE